MNLPSGAPTDWKDFFALWMPALYAAFAALRTIVLNAAETDAGPSPPDAVARLAERDRLSLLGFPLFWALELAWPGGGDRHLALGVLFLSLVTFKALLVLRAMAALHVAADGILHPEQLSRPPHWRLSRCVLALYAAVYVLTSAWQIASISTTGDEPFYLLVTHSLLYDGDVDLRNNLANGDYRPFYWGRLAPYNLVHGEHGEVYSGPFTTAFTALLVPGYALFGRLGAILTVNVFAVMTLQELWWLAVETSGSFRVALWATALLGFSAPLLGFAAQAYPEVPAAWLFLRGLRSTRDLSKGGWRVAEFGLCLAGLPLLKVRFIPLSAGLILAALARLKAARSLVLWLAVPAGAAAVLVLKLDAVTDGLLVRRSLEMRRADIELTLPAQLMWTRQSIVAFLGLLFDQEFGLSATAPFVLVAVAGVPGVLRRYGTPLLTSVVAIVLYAYAIVTIHASDWWAGWSMAGRYWLVLVPLASLWSALTIASTTSLVARTAAVASVLASGAVSFVTVLAPMLRYNRANGTNILAALVGDGIHRPVARFLPSLINPTAEGRTTLWMTLVLLLSAAALGLLLRCVRTSDRCAPGHSVPWITRRTLLGGALALISVGSVLLFLASTIPTTQLEGEAMHATSGIQYHRGPLNVWVLKTSGVLSASVVLSGGPTRIEIDAAEDTTLPPGPHLELWTSGVRVGDCDLPAGSGGWNRRPCVVTGALRRGAASLELRFTNGLRNTTPSHRRHLYVDRIRIQPLPAGSPSAVQSTAEQGGTL